ncbi:MAG: phosphate/phosphite/phosphonate ABC transporter substrate-binding protein [Cyanobacteria bacterium P01_A01_bin.84]
MSVSKKNILSASTAFVVLIGLALATVSCSGSNANNTSGQNQKTLKIAFPGRKDSAELRKKVSLVTAFLSKELGYPVQGLIGSSGGAVESLKLNQSDIAFLSSKPALKAEEFANARLYLAEVRPKYSGKYTYSSSVVVAKDSPLQPKATTKETLAQLKGKRVAFTGRNSTSGFIFPVGELIKQGLVSDTDRLNKFFGEVFYGGNYTGALLSVVRGRSDVAVVSEYALNPPYISEEEKSKLRVLYQIKGVPAHGVAIDDDIPEEKREKIIQALLKLNKPENNKLLRDLYNSTELVKIDHDTHLKPIREALKAIEKKN